jgi:hypothetical protein
MSQEAYDMQQAAIIMARAACCNARIAGMTAENQQRAVEGNSPAYVSDDFERVIIEEGVGHIDVIGFLRG